MTRQQREERQNAIYGEHHEAAAFPNDYRTGCANQKVTPALKPGFFSRPGVLRHSYNDRLVRRPVTGPALMARVVICQQSGIAAQVPGSDLIQAGNRPVGRYACKGRSAP